MFNRSRLKARRWGTPTSGGQASKTALWKWKATIRTLGIIVALLWIVSDTNLRNVGAQLFDGTQTFLNKIEEQTNNQTKGEKE